MTYHLTPEAHRSSARYARLTPRERLGMLSVLGNIVRHDYDVIFRNAPAAGAEANFGRTLDETDNSIFEISYPPMDFSEAYAELFSALLGMHGLLGTDPAIWHTAHGDLTMASRRALEVLRRVAATLPPGAYWRRRAESVADITRHLIIWGTTSSPPEAGAIYWCRAADALDAMPSPVAN